MELNDLIELRKDIIDTSWMNLEELFLISLICFGTYMISSIIFGKESKVTKEVINIWKESTSLIKEERYILKLIFKYSKKFDVIQISDYIYEIGLLNEKTIKYYFTLLDSIYDACELNDENREIRVEKDFITLLESSDYRNKLCSLLLKEDDIKEFLNYSSDFWEYIGKRTVIVDSYIEEYYGVNIKKNNNKLSDIKVFVPEIINLETALVNIQEYKCANDLYKLLGHEIAFDVLGDEFSVREYDERFKEEYMPKVYKKVFGKN